MNDLVIEETEMIEMKQDVGSLALQSPGLCVDLVDGVCAHA
jgi:hypothetical protein